MLVLTDNATDAIAAIASRNDLPAGAGLRIASTNDGNQPLALSTTAGPEEADQVIEGSGARVFIDADAAALLDDKVLDAEVTDQGQVQFLLAPQSP